MSTNARLPEHMEMPPALTRRESEDEERFEQDVETRLRGVKDIVESLLYLVASAVPTNRVFIREGLEELIVKEAVIRWIVRVAKNSTGPGRRALWVDIENGVGDLEKMLEQPRTLMTINRS